MPYVEEAEIPVTESGEVSLENILLRLRGGVRRYGGNGCDVAQKPFT